MDQEACTAFAEWEGEPMKSTEHNADTGRFTIYSLCAKTEWPLLEVENVDALMAHAIERAIRAAEEIAFRAGQDQVREMMQNALDEVGRKVLAEDYSETCRQKLSQKPQNRRKRKSSTFR